MNKDEDGKLSLDCGVVFDVHDRFPCTWIERTAASPNDQYENVTISDNPLTVGKSIEIRSDWESTAFT